jgi:hypothetical protein
MSAALLAVRAPAPERVVAAPLTLGGPAALAESAWMGSPQASEVLEPIRECGSVAWGRRRRRPS